MRARMKRRQSRWIVEHAGRRVAVVAKTRGHAYRLGLKRLFPSGFPRREEDDPKGPDLGAHNPGTGMCEGVSVGWRGYEES